MYFFYFPLDVLMRCIGVVAGGGAVAPSLNFGLLENCPNIFSYLKILVKKWNLQLFAHLLL